MAFGAGVGIAADDILRIMNPFTQVQNVMYRNHEGVGLGLPMAKNLTELHGGTLAIDSELGKGTTVTVAFPAERTPCE